MRRVSVWVVVVLVGVLAPVVGRGVGPVGADPEPPVNLLSGEAAGFESGPLGWVGRFGRVERSLDWSHGGFVSLRAEAQPRPSGEYAMGVVAEPGGVEVTEGETYSASAWVHGSVARDGVMALVFWGPAGEFLGVETGDAVTLATVGGSLLEVEGEAPVGAVSVSAGVSVVTPAVGDAVFVDDVSVWHGELDESDPVDLLAGAGGFESGEGWVGRFASVDRWVSGGYQSPTALRVELGAPLESQPQVAAGMPWQSTVGVGEFSASAMVGAVGETVDATAMVVFADEEGWVGTVAGEVVSAPVGDFALVSVTGEVPEGATRVAVAVGFLGVEGQVAVLDAVDLHGDEGPNVLSAAMADLEVGPLGWAAYGSHVGRALEAAHDSFASLRVEADTADAAAVTALGTHGVAVEPGVGFEATAWVGAADVPRGVELGLEFFDDEGAVAGLVSPASTADVVGVWTAMSVQGIAPAGAAFVAVTVQFPGAEPGEVHYVDDVGLYRLAQAECMEASPGLLARVVPEGGTDPGGFDPSAGPGEASVLLPPAGTDGEPGVVETTPGAEGELEVALGEAVTPSEVAEWPGFETLPVDSVGEHLEVLPADATPGDGPGVDESWEVPEVPVAVGGRAGAPLRLSVPETEAEVDPSPWSAGHDLALVDGGDRFVVAGLASPDGEESAPLELITTRYDTGTQEIDASYGESTPEAGDGGTVAFGSGEWVGTGELMMALGAAATVDDAVVVAGTTQNDDVAYMTVAQVDSDGAPDAGFGGDGARFLPDPEMVYEAMAAYGVAVDGDDRVIAGGLGARLDPGAGPEDPPGSVYGVVARFLGNGSLDEETESSDGFGGDGLVELPRSETATGALVRQVLVEGGGSMFVVVWEDHDTVPGPDETVVWHLDEDGTIDTGFGDAGMVRVKGTALAGLGDGLVVVAQVRSFPSTLPPVVAATIHAYRADTGVEVADQPVTARDYPMSSSGDGAGGVIFGGHGLGTAHLNDHGDVAADFGFFPIDFLTRYARDEVIGLGGGVVKVPGGIEQTGTGGGEDGLAQAVWLTEPGGQVDPGPTLGAPPGAPNGGDPVNLVSGNYHDSWVDLAAPAGTSGMDVTRWYNSADGLAGWVGAGWTSSFEQELYFDDAQVTYRSPDGRRVVFTDPDEDGTWDAEGTDATLAPATGDTWTLTELDGSTESFDANGDLTATSTPDGQSVAVTRTDTTITATSTTGYEVTVHLDDYSQATSIETSDGREVLYAHDNGSLSAVTDPEGTETTYTIDGTSRITRITEPGGVTRIQTTYDLDGRVATQQVADGEVDVFCYGDGEASVIDAATAAVVTYTWDTNGHLTSIADPTDTHFTAVTGYDADGHLTSATDRKESSITQTFDDAGNLLTSDDPTRGESTYTYDSLNRLETATDPVTGTLTYTYDGDERVPATVTDDDDVVIEANHVVDGQVLWSEDADGVRTTYHYDTTGRRDWSENEAEERTLSDLAIDGGTGWRTETTTTPGGHATVEVFDKAGRQRTSTVVHGEADTDPVTEGDPPDAVTAYGYDEAGRQDLVTDPAGAETRTRFDRAGRPQTVTTPTGETITLYDIYGQPVYVRNPDGTHTTQRWGLLGRLESSTDELGRQTRFEYDPNGNQTAVIAPDDTRTETDYDTHSRPTVTRDGLDRETVTRYNALGQVDRVTDPTGARTDTTYDTQGRVHVVTDPRGGETITTYTPAGRVHTVTDPAGVMTESFYDTTGRLDHTTSPLGTTSYGYDLDGNQDHVEAPGDLVTETVFDEAGRPLTVTDPAGVITTKTYTPRGEVHTEAKTGAGTIEYHYDGAGRLDWVDDALDHRTGYTYDWRGNRLTRLDAGANTWRWGYDAAGQKTSATDPLDRVTHWGYDPAGRLVHMDDPSGRGYDDDLDAAGQLQTRTWALDDSTVEWDYDEAGRRTQAVDASGTTTWDYNDAGDLTRLERPGGRIIRWAYDQAGRRTAMTYPSGLHLDYAYDEDTSQLTAISPAQLLADTFTDTDASPLDGYRWADPEATAGGTAQIQGNRARLAATSTAGSAVRVASGLPERENVEVHLEYRTQAASGGTFTVALRDDGDGTRYQAVIDPGEETMALQKVIDGTPTTLDTQAAPASGVLWARVSGSSLLAATAGLGAGDPTGGLTATDTTITSAGAIALTVDGDATIDIDDFEAYPPTGVPDPVLTYTYADDGTVAVEGLPDGQRTYTRADGRLVEYEQDLPGTDNDLDTLLGYDSSGRLETEAEGAVTTTYGYDNADQLTTIAKTGETTRTLTYTDLGQRHTDTLTGVYEYDEAGQLGSVTLGEDETTFDYDPAGRRTARHAPDGDTTYGWDAAGYLGQVDTPVEAGSSLTTGADGVLTHMDGRGLDWDTAVGISRILALPTPGGQRLLVGATGAGAAWEPAAAGLDLDSRDTPPAWRSDPWGAHSELDPGSTGVRGEVALPGRMVHLRSRSYDPIVGGFLSADSLDGVDGTTVVAFAYQYANNSPLDLADPSGKRPMTDDAFDDPCASKDLIYGSGMGARPASEWRSNNIPIAWRYRPSECVPLSPQPDHGDQLYCGVVGTDDCLEARAIGESLATPLARSRYPGDPADGTARNAYQHMMWAALMVIGFNSVHRAERMLAVHEWYGAHLLNPRLDQADLANNFCGVRLGASHRSWGLEARRAADATDRPLAVFLGPVARRIDPLVKGYVAAGKACTLVNNGGGPAGFNQFVDAHRCGW